MTLYNYLWKLMETIHRPALDDLGNHLRRMGYIYTPTSLIVEYTRLIKRDNRMLTTIINVLNNENRVVSDYYPIFDKMFYYIRHKHF
jgi:hypothetical protein